MRKFRALLLVEVTLTASEDEAVGGESGPGGNAITRDLLTGRVLAMSDRTDI